MSLENWGEILEKKGGKNQLIASCGNLIMLKYYLNSIVRNFFK